MTNSVAQPPQKVQTPAKPLVSLVAPEFDLAATLRSGQVFHWLPLEKRDEKNRVGFYGAIENAPAYVEQEREKNGANLLRTNAAPELLARYFALDHPLEEIYRSFPNDPAMAEALAFCRGLRIMRQPAWECLATFITSSMKQVAHIAQISHTIRRKFGAQLCLKLQFADLEMFAYPSAERLAKTSENELRACALGYRAKNLLGSARMISEGKIDLENIRAMDDESARAELMRLPGVGEKIANCVLLFAYERVRAFPIDVWIERVLREMYFAKKRGVTVTKLREFSQTYFGAFGGYAQQYLFHYARSNRPRGGSRKRRGDEPDKSKTGAKTKKKK